MRFLVWVMARMDAAQQRRNVGDFNLVKSATLRASTLNATPAHLAGGATEFLECCGHEEHWSSLRFLTHILWLRLLLYVEGCFQVNNIWKKTFGLLNMAFIRQKYNAP